MSSSSSDTRLPDWEAFYRDYRKPGYVRGFEITTKLGGGMFGLVFRARKQSIGKDYAIKFLQVDDTEVRRAVIAELEQVKLFAQIDHPNLVSIEDRGEVDGIPYLVMAFAGTQTLKDRLPTDGKLPTVAEREELLRYFLQACRGTAALHERSLVHFDIKPANIFLKGPVARIGDYGLSKLVTHSRGSLSMGRGTPYYMAPEMLQRRGDHRSDIYSLGIVLYELLCGSVPFRGDSEWEVLRKHEQEAPVLPDHLSLRERSVLQRCLQKDPAARFLSVNDIVAALAGAEPPVLDVGDAAAVLGSALGALDGQDLPSCVAPPLPSTKPAATLRRSAWSAWGLVLLFVAGLSWVLVRGAGARVTMARESATARSTSKPVKMPVSSRQTGDSLAARVDRLVDNVEATLRASIKQRKPVALRPLDCGPLGMSQAMGFHKTMVDSLADAPEFSPGHAQKLARGGRGTFLAAVAMLQELDYRDEDDCRRGANVQQFLQQATGVGRLCADCPSRKPSNVETCRCQAFADGWRRLAEQFAKTDADYDLLLAAKGPSAVNGAGR